MWLASHKKGELALDLRANSIVSVKDAIVFRLVSNPTSGITRLFGLKKTVGRLFRESRR